MKSKFFAIVLILAFVVPLATTYMVLHFHKKQVKRELKRKLIASIDKSELVLLKFTEEEKQSQLEWEHAKEFEYKNEMYDVIDSKTIGDTTFYWVWWDFEETKLYKQLQTLVSYALGNNPQHEEENQRINNFFKSLYFSEKNTDDKLLCIDKQSIYKYLEESYLSFKNSPSVPPPKIF